MANRMPPTASNGLNVDQHRATFSLVEEFSRELFQGGVTIRPEADPEYPSNYFVVTVAAIGSADELVELNDRWHREIRQIAGDAADQYRLALDVQ
jgi:hypothetical protein